MASEINDSLDTLLKIKELIAGVKTSDQSIANPDDELAILNASIIEQQNMYGHINNIYDQLRIKALALIAGEVAIVTFLFSNWDFRNTLFGGDRVFFFFAGVILLGMAFAILLWIIAAVEWKMPHGVMGAEELM